MSHLIAGFEVLEKIGEGGMGVVFRARDPQLDRIVALKLLRHGLENSKLRDRFRQEARAAARLENPHIVTIYSFGEHEGAPFIAMEFVPGLTLSQLIRLRVPLAIVQKLELVEALCDGLAYAHGQGVVHRDIKPSNVIVGVNGVLKILDFGLARAFRGSGLTHTHSLMGTPNYMSPEQFGDPKTVDHRTDIFAVGAVLYELMTDRQAFPGELLSAMNAILREDPSPFGEALKDLDPRIEKVTLHALRKEPASRFQDLRHMQDELSAIRQDLIAVGTGVTGPPLRQLITAQFQVTGHESAGDFSPWHETAPVKVDSALSPVPRDSGLSSQRTPLGRIVTRLTESRLASRTSVLATAGVVALAVTLWGLGARGLLSGAEADNALPVPVPITGGSPRDRDVRALRETAAAAVTRGDFEQALQALTAATTLTPLDAGAATDVDRLIAALRKQFSEDLQQLPGEPLDPRVVSDYREALDLDRRARESKYEGAALDAAALHLAANTMLAGVLARAVRKAPPVTTPAAAGPRDLPSSPTGAGAVARPSEQSPDSRKVQAPPTRPEQTPEPAPAMVPAVPAPKPSAESTSPTVKSTVQRPASKSPAEGGVSGESTGDHEAAIRSLLHEFEQGYERLDPAIIRRVWPSAPARLERDLANVRSYRLNLADIRIQLAGDSATVTCVRQISLQPAVGRQQTASPRTEIRLRRENGRWVITSLQ